jgi:hypothetical protein
VNKHLSPQFSLFAHSPDGTVQAPLFATPHELLASKPVLGDILANDGLYMTKPHHRGNDGYEVFDALRERKLGDAKTSNDWHELHSSKSRNLYEDVKKHGVKEPINVVPMPPHELDEPEAGPYLHVADGHHRLFSAAESRPTEHLLLDYNTASFTVREGNHEGWPRRPRRYPGQPE